MFPNTKYDICKVVQQEIDDGDTCALYGVKRKVESPVAHVHAEWRPFTETPPQDALYEVLWSGGELKGFSVFESGCWRRVEPFADLAIAEKGRVSQAILKGQVVGWRPMQKEP